MGCEQSHEDQPGPPFFSSNGTLLPDTTQAPNSRHRSRNYNTRTSTSSEAAPLMGSSTQPTNPPKLTRLAAQHERLILELLPCKTPALFHEWIAGRFVRGSWHEYCRDFLSQHPTSPEPDKEKVCKAAKKAVNDKDAKFVIYFPEKEGWTAEDHVVRFIVTVVSDNFLKGLWSKGDWNKGEMEVCKAVYEVLSFLRQTEFAERNAGNLPGYSEAVLQ